MTIEHRQDSAGRHYAKGPEIKPYGSGQCIITWSAETTEMAWQGRRDRWRDETYAIRAIQDALGGETP